MTLLLALLAVSSATVAAPDFKPAQASAILAGGKACVGATVDPTGQASRLEGWTPASTDAVAAMKTRGDVVTRDNVMLVFKTGEDGGCVVIAKTDTAFDRPAFYSELSALVGAPVSTDPNKTTDLPNGEILIAIVGPEAAGANVQLVIANRKGRDTHP